MQEKYSAATPETCSKGLLYQKVITGHSLLHQTVFDFDQIYIIKIIFEYGRDNYLVIFKIPFQNVDHKLYIALVNFFTAG